MTSRICKYNKCRNDSLAEEEYCKYHKRLREIEMQGPLWLNEMIKEVKTRIVEAEESTYNNEQKRPSKLGGDFDALETEEHL